MLQALEALRGNIAGAGILAAVNTAAALVSLGVLRLLEQNLYSLMHFFQKLGAFSLWCTMSSAPMPQKRYSGLHINPI